MSTGADVEGVLGDLVLELVEPRRVSSAGKPGREVHVGPADAGAAADMLVSDHQENVVPQDASCSDPRRE